MARSLLPQSPCCHQKQQLRPPRCAAPPHASGRRAAAALRNRPRALSSSDNDASPLNTFDFTSSSGASSSAGSSSGPSTSSSSAAAASDPDFGYLSEYAALKKQLLDNTRKSGGAIGLYLLLTVNGAAALAAMVGTAASYAYLAWLCRDVDNVKATDTVPIWEANKIENVLLRRAAKLTAAYRAALTPRLLVPVSLGLLVGCYSALSRDEPLQLVYPGCLLLGFLSYKAALVVKLVDDLSPKAASSEPARPVVEKFEDELDQWGRPRKRLANPIDAMPADAQAKAYEQLEQQLAKEARREQQEQ